MTLDEKNKNASMFASSKKCSKLFSFGIDGVILPRKCLAIVSLLSTGSQMMSLVTSSGI
jgi:hypothetical protein